METINLNLEKFQKEVKKLEEEYLMVELRRRRAEFLLQALVAKATQVPKQEA